MQDKGNIVFKHKIQKVKILNKLSYYQNSTLTLLFNNCVILGWHMYLIELKLSTLTN